MNKNLEIEASQYQIPAKIYLPEDELQLKEMIIACHGFAGDKESSAIKLLAEEMIKDNIGVICFDFPGHGESKVDGNKLTIENCIQDINTVEEYIKQNYKNIPISIFSTSFGAYITLINTAKNNKQYNNIILRSPAIEMAKTFRNALLREEEAKYKKRGYTKLGFNRELIIPYGFIKKLEQNNILNMYKNVEVPKIHIIHGDKDEMAPLEDAKKFTSLSENIELYIIEGAGHRMKGEGELEKAIEYSKKIILNK